MIKPELHVIDKAAVAKGLEYYIQDKEYIAYDLESTGLTKRHEVIGLSICTEETQAFYIILAIWDKETQALKYLETKDIIIDLLNALKQKKLLMHNGVYDCMMTESNFGVSLIDSLYVDTMVAAHLINENRRVGLKELALTELGLESNIEQIEMKESIIANGGKITKDAYELYKADAYLIGKYGAKDAWLTYMLFLKLIPELYEQRLDQFFFEDECMPLLRGPTYQLNTTGVNVDMQYLTTLKKTLEAECLEAREYIYQEIGPHIKDKYPGTNKKNIFNIGASQQLSWLLFGKLGLEFGTLTDGGKDACAALGMKLPYTVPAKRAFISACERSEGISTAPEAIVNGKKVRAKKLKAPWAYIAVDKKTLAKLAPKHRWIEKLLEYQKKTKIINTYLEGIQERVSYGVLQPSFKQTGTTSGRYSSSNPNLQNLPRDDQRVKQCIIARPGKVFVSADFSQLEPRVFSYYSQDKRLMSAFDGKSDFYSVVGIPVFGKYDALPLKEGHPDAFGVKYKSLRDMAKGIALALAYGATPHQLAPMIGRSVDEVIQIAADYFEEFPGVLKQMLEAHDLAKKNGYVTSLFGRPRRMPEALRIPKMYGNAKHADLPYEARNILNLACNHRIQSTGASIVNRSMIKFFNDCATAGVNAVFVSQIHDELVVECDEADGPNIAILLQNAMETTVILEGVPLEAIPRITKSLAK